MPPEDNSSPLLIDNAVSFMFSKPDENAAADDNAAASGAAETSTDNTGTDAGAGEHAETTAEAAAEGEQDTPADQGETTEGQGDQGDHALPPIDPPKSWTTEEKALWTSLNRPAQEAILRRDQADTKALRDLQNSQAEQRKAAEAEVTRLRGLASKVEAVVNKEVADLAREFPEIKSEQDVVLLAQSDPARAQLFQAKLAALNATMQTRNDVQAEVGRVSEKEFSERQAQTKEALLAAFPAWKDPEVARREVTEIQDYAIKSGAPEAAARGTTDPVIYTMAKKAMLYDRAQAAKASAVTRTPPRAVKPGTQSASPRDTANEATRRSQLEKLSRTGDVADAVSLMFSR